MSCYGGGCFFFIYYCFNSLCFATSRQEFQNKVWVLFTGTRRVIHFVWCYVIDTGSEASVVASCDGEPHTLHTHGPVQCCFHYRISTTFPTCLLNLSDSVEGFLVVSCSHSL